MLIYLQIQGPSLTKKFPRGRLDYNYHHHSSRSPQLITYSRNELLSLRRFSPARLPFQLVSVLKDFGLLQTRGCRAGVWAKSRTRQRGIRTVISNRPDRFSKFASLLNRDNLVKVPISQNANTQDTSHAISFCLLNSRSVRNKSSVLKDFVVDKDIDLLALSDTWLRLGCSFQELKDDQNNNYLPSTVIRTCL